jgi:hypothetical protein
MPLIPMDHRLAVPTTVLGAVSLGGALWLLLEDRGDYAFWAGALGVLFVVRGIGEWLMGPESEGIVRRLRWEGIGLGLGGAGLVAASACIFAGWLTTHSNRFIVGVFALAGAAAALYGSVKAWCHADQMHSNREGRRP